MHTSVRALPVVAVRKAPERTTRTTKFWSRAIGLLLVLVSESGLCAQVVPQVGEPAPPIALDKFVQAPEGAKGNLEALRGKAVVLEFWATWCGGCVENIPHMNAVAEEFKDRPLQFISITDEQESVVRRFLKSHPMSGWVASDPQQRSFKTYFVQGIPRTFLIDPRGVLQATTSPMHVSESVLENLLEGKALDLPRPEAAALRMVGTEPGAPPPLVEVLIRPAAPVEISGTSPGGESFTGGRYEAFGITLCDLIARVHDFPQTRIDAPEWCRESLYDVSVVVPHGDDPDRWPLVQQVIATSFHLKLHRELRETNVYSLRKVPGLEPKLRVSATSETNSRPWGSTGEFDAVGAQLKALTRIASVLLDAEVFDETGLQGRYDFELKWNHQDARSIIPAIREQLCLELVPFQRKLEHIVVESAQQPTTW